MKTVVAKPEYLCDRLWEKLKGLGGKTADGLKAWQSKRDQAALESSLARIIDTANSHKAKGTPNGSPVYFSLRDKAFDKINAFCAKHSVDRNTILAQMPALNDLVELTVVKQAIPKGVQMLMVLVGSVVTLILLGLGSGLVSTAHIWVVNHLVR